MVVSVKVRYMRSHRRVMWTSARADGTHHWLLTWKNNREFRCILWPVKKVYLSDRNVIYSINHASEMVIPVVVDSKNIHNILEYSLRMKWSFVIKLPVMDVVQNAAECGANSVGFLTTHVSLYAPFLMTFHRLCMYVCQWMRNCMQYPSILLVPKYACDCLLLLVCSFPCESAQDWQNSRVVPKTRGTLGLCLYLWIIYMWTRWRLIFLPRV